MGSAISREFSINITKLRAGNPMFKMYATKISHLEVENGKFLGSNIHFGFTLNLFLILYGRVQKEKRN